jgi:hypothetical protein
MKGLFIPGITVEMFRSGCLESIEALMAEGEIYDIEYEPERKTGKWILLEECANAGYYCSECRKRVVKEGWSGTVKKIKFCPNCGAKMEV